VIVVWLVKSLSRFILMSENCECCGWLSILSMFSVCFLYRSGMVIRFFGM